MKIINPSFEFVDNISADEVLNKIEAAYRICYLSEPKGNRDDFIKTKITAGHESPLEHVSISVIITTNRGVTHELVRHRIASYCQESTRYCNYSKDKFGSEITFIRPDWVTESVVGEWHYITPELIQQLNKCESHWFSSCLDVERDYFMLINNGWQPQQARDVLNNSVATKIMVTMNVREWRHFFKLRALGVTGKPHPEMVQIAKPMLEAFRSYLPILFDDLKAGE